MLWGPLGFSFGTGPAIQEMLKASPGSSHLLVGVRGAVTLGVDIGGWSYYNNLPACLLSLRIHVPHACRTHSFPVFTLPFFFF